MDTETANYLRSGVKIGLPGASLRLLSGKPGQVAAGTATKFRIGWFLLKADVASASVRYRCFHFARAMAGEFDSVYFSRFQDLKDSIHDLDVIVVVKRLDRTNIDVAALARQWNKPVFLDLCDDLAHPSYPSRDDPGIAMTALMAMAPVLTGITVPSADMAERIDGYLAASGFASCRCIVIPDIAETRALNAVTDKFIADRNRPTSVAATPLTSRPVHREACNQAPSRIVWFGNFGAVHSNFGMFSLKSRLRPLREFHQTHPVELVVVSNNRAVFDALVDGCGFPARYVDWSAKAVYDELEQADAALLTSGDDEFCTVKSSNRVLQALAAGVPVIADKSAALAEFEDVIFAGNFRAALDACLGKDSAVRVRQRLQQAEQILRRFSPERLGAIWAGLLREAIGQVRVRRSQSGREGLVLLLEPGDSHEDAMAAVVALNRVAGTRFQLLVSTELLEKDVRFRKVIHRSKALPAFFKGALRGIESQFSGTAVILLGNPASANGKAISAYAGAAGITLARLADIHLLDLADLAVSADDGPAAGTRPPPGPYPQRTNPDGSVDWAFVIHRNARGWILDAICQEIGSRQPESWLVVDHDRPPPPAKNLFFSHFSLLDIFDRKYPEVLAASKVFLWYTHPREETAETIARSLKLFESSERIVFTCEANRRTWIERGLSPERTAVVLGAADSQLFRPHARGGGEVGLSSSFYERKNPDLMLEVIRRLPHRGFTLLGKNWSRYARFEELLAMPNFTYLSAPYRDYPAIYAGFDVFLSISTLEGGPIPLVEAMMCNAFPVASNTGLAPDLIKDGENGLLFDPYADADHVANLIERAFESKVDVRATVEQYSWDRFSAQIIGLAA